VVLEINLGRDLVHRQIASLREYVLIAQDERTIEVFRREQEWHGEVASPRVHYGSDEVI